MTDTQKRTIGRILMPRILARLAPAGPGGARVALPMLGVSASALLDKYLAVASADIVSTIEKHPEVIIAKGRLVSEQEALEYEAYLKFMNGKGDVNKNERNKKVIR